MALATSSSPPAISSRQLSPHADLVSVFSASPDAAFSTAVVVVSAVFAASMVAAAVDCVVVSATLVVSVVSAAFSTAAASVVIGLPLASNWFRRLALNCFEGFRPKHLDYLRADEPPSLGKGRGVA